MTLFPVLFSPLWRQSLFVEKCITTIDVCAHARALVHMWGPEDNLVEPVLDFQFDVGSGARTQIPGLHGKCFSC